MVALVGAALITLEPLKRAVAALMADALPAFIDRVAQDAAQRGYPDAKLQPPAHVLLSTVEEYRLIQRWPTLTVDTRMVVPRTSSLSEQLGGESFEGTLELRYFAQDPDQERLATALDRYAAALHLALVYGDELRLLGPTRLNYERWNWVAAEASGATPFQRAVSLLVAAQV